MSAKKFRSAQNGSYGEERKLLPLNHILSSKPFIAAACGVVTVVIFLGGTILANCLTGLSTLFTGESIHYLAFSWDYLWWYLVLLLISAILCALLAYKLRTNFQELNIGQKGHNRFATLEEIQQRLLAIPERDTVFEGPGGLPEIRQGKTLYIQNNIQNNLIVAMTRAGKGETLVISSMEIYSRASVRQSMVIFDVKGELSRATIPRLLERGYGIQLLDFIAPEHSMHWNPLHIALEYWQQGDLAAAEQVCATIGSALYEDPNARDRFWVDAPRDLFVAVALAHLIDCGKEHPEQVNMVSVARFLMRMGGETNSSGSALEQFFKKRSFSDRAKMKYSTIKFAGGSGKTLAGVLSIASSKLTMFTYEYCTMVTATNDIWLDQIAFGEKPMAVFIRVPHYDRTFYPIATMFINQVYFYSEKRASEENKGVLPRPIKVVGDEIFNAPPIDDIENKVSAALGSGFSFDFYAQSFEQMEKVYGKEAAAIIEDNCASQFYLMSGMEATREKVSKDLGNYTIKNVSRMGERLSLGKNITENYEERPLKSAAELKELEEGEQIVVHKLQRRDLSGNKIKALPVFAHGDTALIYRHEYLPDWDPQQDIPYDKLALKPFAFSEELLYQPPLELPPVKPKAPAPVPTEMPTAPRTAAAGSGTWNPTAPSMPETEEQHRLFLDGRPAKEELSGYYTTFHNTLHLPDADLTLGEVAKSLVRQYHLGSISQETYEKLWNILTRKAAIEFG